MHRFFHFIPSPPLRARAYHTLLLLTMSISNSQITRQDLPEIAKWLIYTSASRLYWPPFKRCLIWLDCARKNLSLSLVFTLPLPLACMILPFRNLTIGHRANFKHKELLLKAEATKVSVILGSSSIWSSNGNSDHPSLFLI